QNKLKGFNVFSINFQIRVIFEFVDTNTVWFHSIGSHDIYK
ncbi:type II toxin-antitoxin system mRNA interferase toxin, RelE/StbE family, partial [Candidatus Shapirobacteria bacterium CG_4_9_14_3_um_filter_36_12]